MTAHENDLSTLPPGCRLVRLGKITSSNDEAKRLAAEGAADGTLVWAREQTGGRGRRGRTWSSPPGNLYISVVLRPDCPALEAQQLGFAGALAAADTIAAFLPAARRITLKWPNDVLVDGAKICGMLMESSLAGGQTSLDWLVLGMGMNLAHCPDDTPYPATSLAAAGGAATPVAALAVLAQRLMHWRQRWRQDGFAPLRAAWLDRAQGLGEEIEVRSGEQSLRGRFSGLDADGALLLDQGAGAPLRVTLGDVFPAKG